MVHHPSYAPPLPRSVFPSGVAYLRMRDIVGHIPRVSTRVKPFAVRTRNKLNNKRVAKPLFTTATLSHLPTAHGGYEGLR